MINKLNKQDINLVNELVNFIFVKQSNKDYKINNFPNNFNGIKHYIKNQNVYYIKEDSIKLILIFGDKEIDYLYYEDLSYLKDNVTILKNKEFAINKDNIMINDLTTFNENNKLYYVIELFFNNKTFKQNIDKSYIVIPLYDYLIEDYLKIHSQNKYNNYDVIVCIKNNEMIGYLDYKGKEILEIGGLIKNEFINQNTVKQLLFNYLKFNKANYVVYETDNEMIYNSLLSIGFNKKEENLKFDF